MQEEQARTLLSRILVDKEFRDRLVKSPLSTAMELGIALTEAEGNVIKCSKEAILSDGAAADSALSKAKLKELLIHTWQA